MNYYLLYEKVYLSLLIFAIMFLKHCAVLDLEKFLWKKIEWKGNARKPWLILAHPKTHCNYYGATSLVLSKINLYCIFVLVPPQWYVFLKKWENIKWFLKNYFVKMISRNFHEKFRKIKIIFTKKLHYLSIF